MTAQLGLHPGLLLQPPQWFQVESQPLVLSSLLCPGIPHTPSLQPPRYLGDPRCSRILTSSQSKLFGQRGISTGLNCAAVVHQDYFTAWIPAAGMMPPLSSPAWDEKSTVLLPALSHCRTGDPSLAMGTGRALARAVPGCSVLTEGCSGLSLQIPGSSSPCLRPGRLFCSALQEMPLE